MSCKGINTAGASYKQDQTRAGKVSYVAVGTVVSIFDKNVIKRASSMKSSFKTYPQLT